MKFLSLIFFLNVYFTFQQTFKILEKGKLLLNEINDNDYYIFKYIISKDDELIIPINIYLNLNENFNYYTKCSNEDSIPTFNNNDERILKYENIDSGTVLYEDFPSINECKFLFIKIKFLKYNQLSNFNISIPQNYFIIKYRDNYVNFKYEEINENESKEPFYFIFNQDIANIFFFSKNNLIKVYYGNSNNIFSREYNQFSYIPLSESIKYDSKIIIRLFNNNKITYSYLMSNKYFGFSEYDFSNLNILTIPFNIPDCEDNEILIFGGFNSIKKVYLINEHFIGDFNISYSNIFGNSYAFNYIDFKDINFNYQEFNSEFMVFKIKCNKPTIFNFKLIQPMNNISFLKIKNDEYFYNIFDFKRENQKEIQINSSDILDTKITFYPKSNDDNNTVTIKFKDNNYTLSNKNNSIHLKFEPQIVFIIEGKEKSLLSFESNSFKSFNQILINNHETFFLTDEYNLFYINISNITNSIFNFEVIINLNETNVGQISYEYYKKKNDELFFPEIPLETKTQIISKNFPFKINISNPNNYYEIENNYSIYFLIRLSNQDKKQFLVNTKSYFLINNITSLPSKKINIINKSENNELIFSFLHNKDLNNPYICIQIYPCNISLTSNNYLFQDNNGNKLSNFISSDTFIKYYLNSYKDIHLLIQNKVNIENFLLWYDYKKNIDYIKYPKNKIAILNNKKLLQIEFNSINPKIEYIYNIYYTETPLFDKCPYIINEQKPLVSFKNSGEKWIKYTIHDFNYSKGYINVEGVRMDKSFKFFYETKNIEEIGEVYSKNEKNDFYNNYYLGSYSYLVFELIVVTILIIILFILCSCVVYKRCVKTKKKGYEIPKTHDSMELSELKQNKT